MQLKLLLYTRGATLFGALAPIKSIIGMVSGKFCRNVVLLHLWAPVRVAGVTRKKCKAEEILFASMLTYSYMDNGLMYM